ncbi:hypothetical protein BDE02_06G148400 [Populus trichocarpa]|nr:hypothetical protein BDE02_06G148400 [Populus trichocarpa]
MLLLLINSTADRSMHSLRWSRESASSSSSSSLIWPDMLPTTSLFQCLHLSFNILKAETIFLLPVDETKIEFQKFCIICLKSATSHQQFMNRNGFGPQFVESNNSCRGL